MEGFLSVPPWFAAHCPRRSAEIGGGWALLVKRPVYSTPLANRKVGIDTLIKLALVGLGSMGANHLRVAQANPRCALAKVVDVNPQAARAAAGDVEVSTTVDELAGVDAAIIASSTASHFELASALLRRRIPLLVEKPLATTAAEVAALVQLSEEFQTPLMCGFVERFNPVVVTSKGLITDELLHVRTQRQSPPPGRSSSNALWDLLIHDLDLVLSYFPGAPCRSLAAVSAPEGNVAGIEAVEASFEIQGAIVNSTCSRQWQRKVRAVQLATRTTLLELDLLRQTLTTYRNISQEQVSEGALIYRAATTVDVPFVRHSGEPLRLQLDHFLDLVEGNDDAAAERATILPPHELAESIEALCA